MIHALTFAAYAVTLDGKTVLPRARAAVAGGHVLLPVRALGNALGAEVGYDGRAHTITVQRGAHVVTISARGAVRIVKGSAYAPLRAVATTFGLSVGYDAATRTVALDDRGVAAPLARRDAPNPSATQPSAASYVISLQPPSGAEVHDPYPAISVRFAGAASLDPRSLHVLLDGRDVSAEAAVVGDQILLTPRRALAPGPHAVSVSARDASGTPLVQQWSFVDTFAFAVAAPPTPFPVSAIWIDRWITPGTNAFDVYVEGAPGMTGYVGVDGIGGFFPLVVYSANAYVAHVVVPFGVNQPFARVAARITFPNGETQTIVLPQRINLFTLQPKALPPPPTARPIVVPTRRSVDVPTPTPSPPRRMPVTTTPAPSAPPPAATPAAVPTRTPLPAPTRTPTPVSTRMPVQMPTRVPLQVPTRVPVQIHTPAPATAPPTATPTATPTPTPQRTRRPIIRRTPPPSPPPG